MRRTHVRTTIQNENIFHYTVLALYNFDSGIYTKIVSLVKLIGVSHAKKVAAPRPWPNNTFLHNNIIHVMIVNLEHPLAKEKIFNTIKQVHMTSSTQFNVEYT